MAQRDTRWGTGLALSIELALSGFLADVYLPLGIVAGILYMVVIASSPSATGMQRCGLSKCHCWSGLSSNQHHEQNMRKVATMETILPFAQSISPILNFKLTVKRSLQPQSLQHVLLH
jgi:hypothetical protein